ncbi:hypothetical protein [Roseobacter sp. HKCCD7870]|uniref:hypothetical protein n=1 Tax=Roseobacter sp. HKCCD7870 TaxID=3120343 RepID=UPI0030ECCFAF
MMGGFSSAADEREANDLDCNTAEAFERSEDCAFNWKASIDNEDFINNSQRVIRIRCACMRAVEGRARFGEPDWGGWLITPFSNYYNGTSYIDTGVVRLVDREVKLQNGFGAMVNSIASCTYDLEQDEVISVSVD